MQLAEPADSLDSKDRGQPLRALGEVAEARGYAENEAQELSCAS